MKNRERERGTDVPGESRAPLDRSGRKCLVSRACDEANVPTAQYSACSDARFSRAHVHAGRSPGAAEPPTQGPKAPGAEGLQEVVVPDFAGDRRLRRHAEFVRAQ